MDTRGDGHSFAGCSGWSFTPILAGRSKRRARAAAPRLPTAWSLPLLEDDDSVAARAPVVLDRVLDADDVLPRHRPALLIAALFHDDFNFGLGQLLRWSTCVELIGAKNLVEAELSN